MTIKVKILGENKQKVDEGLGALLDPTLLASIAVGLGVGIPFLQSILGSSDRKAIENMSAQEAADYIDNVVYGSKKKADAARKKREADRKRREEELRRRIQAAKDKNSKEAPEQEDMLRGIEMQPGIEPSSSEIPEKIIKRYARIRAMADDERTDPGTRSNAQRMARKFEEENPGIANDPRLESYMLQEVFKRFL